MELDRFTSTPVGKGQREEKRPPGGLRRFESVAVDCDQPSLTLGAATTEALVKAINAAAGVDRLLLAGIKRVAL